LPIFFMEVELADQSVLFPLVDVRATRRKNLTCTLEGRGWQELPPVIIRSRFPINFFIRYRGGGEQAAALVFPRPIVCGSVDQPDPGGHRGIEQTWLKGQDGDISRISDYRGGEPLKMIHWKLSARHDKLKVKELSAATDTPVILDLAYLPGTDLEQRLRCATYLVSRFLRSGRPVGLRFSHQEFAAGLGRSHKLQLLKALALYGQHQETA
jgi:uncharacterized protein (DUF58 family)